MQRKRSGVYNTGPSVSQHRTSFFGHDSGYFGSRNSAKDLFSDFRVEMDREIASKHFNHPAYLRSKASVMRSLMPSKAPPKAKTAPSPAHDVTVAVPVDSRQIQRRCQSASAVRKKLIHAVEQGSEGGGYQHPNHKLQAQIDALRDLTSSSYPQVSSKAQSGYRAPSADMSTVSILYGAAKPPRATTNAPVSNCKPQNQEEFISGVGIGPGRSASFSSIPAQTSATASNNANHTSSVLVGGYRSSSVQLEVELVERLNEIGRSNLPEKTLSRTRACQSVLDTIVQQDEHYGRLLARIRDEFNTYVDITSRKSPVKSSGKNASKSWCACGQDVFEFALVRQENVVLKKRVSCMQQEIENLQAALEKAKMVDRNNDCPEDDIAGDELDSIQLFPAEDVNIQYCRPQIVPMLSFASLPAYEDDDEEEGLDEEEYMQ